ncbi:hypothetical protein [Micromonospora profundi]|uniref:hypothetical protein n=1 Tax=Micromonospora profundi TaxID=1420889 RepID=UPI00365C48AF
MAASQASLGYLILTSGAKPGALTAMSTHVAHGHYAQLAAYAERQAGKLVPADAARVIATDARTLAAG